MFTNKTERIVFFLVLALALVAYFAGLWIEVARDAGKYATVSKEILENKDFIHLTIHGHAYDQKPPMLFWLGALGYSIGDVSSFWFKLPVLLLVFAGFYWSFKLGESLYGKRVGGITAFLLFFSFIYFMYTMDIHTDTPLQAFVVLALWQLYEFIKHRKTINWFLGFVAIGLAMLTKGPVGAAIPAFAVVGHIMLKKDFQFLMDYRWYLGIVIAFVLASPALVGLWNQFGWDGLWFFFWENNVGRIAGTYTNTFSDPFFFVHSLLYLFMPWCILLFASLFLEIKSLIKNKFKAKEYFSFTGIWIFFLIINLSRSQLPNYVFSIVPLMAVIIAKWIDIALSNSGGLLRIFNRVQIGVIVALWILYFLVGSYSIPVKNAWYYFLAFAGIAFSVYILSRKHSEMGRLFLPSAIVLTCLVFLLNTHTYPIMYNLQAPPKAAKYYSENAMGERLYNYKYKQYELFFFSYPQAQPILEEDNVEKIAASGNCWIFTNEEGYEELLSMNIKPREIMNYDHFSMKHAARYILPLTRENTRETMYLLKF